MWHLSTTGLNTFAVGDSVAAHQLNDEFARKIVLAKYSFKKSSSQSNMTTGRYSELGVWVRSKLGVDELSVWVIFLHCLHLLLVAGGSFIRLSQSEPDLVVLHDSMVLLPEQSRSFPVRWKPELETRQPRV